MTRFRRINGTLVEPLGHLWAAFSPLSGETSLLNDESAAILEVLESGPGSTEQVCDELSRDSGVHFSDLAPLVGGSWQSLIDAGLVQALDEAVTFAE